MSLREMLSDYWYAFQQELFPGWRASSAAGRALRALRAVLELRVEAFFPTSAARWGARRRTAQRWRAPPSGVRHSATQALIERLEVDGRLWRLCGWSRRPATARRPFRGPFPSLRRLASRLHETLIARTMDGHLVEHISRDATAIEAREKAAPKPKAAKPKRRKRGQGRGAGEAAEPAGTATDDEPSADDGGPAHGLRCRHQAQRQGPYHLLGRIKLHVDTGGVPISAS